MSNFWLYNPAILFDKNEIMNFWPKSDMELSQKLNAITRIVILLTLVGLILTRSLRILVTSIITLVVLVILYKTQYEDEEKEDLKEKFLSEGFANQNAGDDNKFVRVFRDTFTNPTEKNPLMNVMMDDYKYNPQKKRAAPSYNNNIKKEILEKAKPDSKLFLDLGDSFAYEKYSS